MIIVYFQIKGGVGNSTLSTNDVTYYKHKHKNAKIIYVNSDPNSESARHWVDSRAEDSELAHIVSITKFGKTAGRDILKLSEDYDVVVVDLGATDEATDRSILLVADVVVMAFSPSAPDVWTTEEKTLRTLREIKSINDELRVVAVINQAPSYKNDSDVRDVIESFNEQTADDDDISLAKTTVKLRKAYRTAFKNGRGVVELTGKYRNKKAIEEIKNLHEDIYNER